MAALGKLELAFDSIASGLDSPVAITNAGDGSDRLFVIEKDGLIRIIEDGVLLDDPFLDVSGLVTKGGEQGLLGVAFSPDYETDGEFYVNYTKVGGDTVIARYQVSADNPNQADAASAEVLLTIEQPFGNHNGGQIAFGPDGYLYIGMGDGGSGGDPLNNAQNPESLLGKMLRIDVSGTQTYTVPESNPFTAANDPNDEYRDEIWAIGFRNPWRFSFDRETGDLYIGDVGQATREEIDFQSADSKGGENYGWRIMEGSTCFEDDCDKTGLVLPVAEYGRSEGASVTGGYVYRGTDKDLQGVYLYGDFINGRIWGLQPKGDSWKNVLLTDTPYGISTFGEDEAGNLYVADYFTGDIYLITADAEAIPPIEGTADDDALEGTDGKDVILGLAGNDTLRGLDGKDALLGGKDNDRLLGGEGNDRLEGGQGVDRLKGGSGNNQLIGGGDRDLFFLQPSGFSLIEDFTDRVDRLRLTGGLSFDDLTIRQRGENTLIKVEDDRLALLEGVQANKLSIADFVG